MRVVHACWAPDAIAEMRRREAESVSVLDLYVEYVRAFERRWNNSEHEALLVAECGAWDLENMGTRPPLIPLLAKRDTARCLVSGDSPVKRRDESWSVVEEW